LAFIFSKVRILPFPCLTLLASNLVHHNDAYLRSLRETSFTFLSSEISLNSKILSTVYIHSRKSSGSSLPSNSGRLTLKSLELEMCLFSLLGCLGESSSLWEPPERGPSSSSSPRAEPGVREEDELLSSLLFCLKESPSYLLKYSFWLAISSLRAWRCLQFFMIASNRSSKVILELILAHRR